MKFRIKAYLFNNLGLKLLSLALAFLLWFMVINEHKTEIVMKYPLGIKNVPAGMVVINDVVETISVKLRGPKSILTALIPEEISLDLGIRRVSEGDNLIPLKIEEIKTPRGIEILNLNPSRIKVVLERTIEREVEVVPIIKGTVAEGYTLKRVTVEPREIKVVGAKSLVARLSKVHTFPIDIERKTRGFQVEVQLDLSPPRLALKEDRPVVVRVEIREAIKRQ